MAIRILPEGDRYVAEVTPPEGQWRTPQPMTEEELALALKNLGIDRRAASDAFMEALLQSYGTWAEEYSSPVLTALRGERRVPVQSSFSEAWLSYVLYEMGVPITLRMLIEDADSLNHAIPTPDEVSWALLQLKKRMWLAMEGDSYSLTREGRATIEGIAFGKDSWEKIKRLEEWMRSHPPSSEG